jgi:hypothetical protein
MFFVIKEDFDVLATMKNVLLEKSALLSYVRITISCEHLVKKKLL